MRIDDVNDMGKAARQALDVTLHRRARRGLGRLRAAGTGMVEALFLDTLADEARFFSHRRRTLAGGGVIGHQMSIITL